MCVSNATQGCVQHVTFTNCEAGAPTPACLWPARRTRSRRSSHVVHDTAPIPGIIIPGAREKTPYIDLFQYLSLRLLFEEEDLFHFYVSFVWRFAFHFEGAYFRQLRGSLFGGFKSGRRGLLTRAKKAVPGWPLVFSPGV